MMRKGRRCVGRNSGIQRQLVVFIIGDVEVVQYLFG
jgi:hypothetical protein